MQDTMTGKKLFGDGKDEGILVDAKTGAITVQLLHAVHFENSQVTEITLRRPRGRDLQAMDKQGGTWGVILYMIDTLSDCDIPAVSHQMDVADINRAALVVADFFGGSLKTGGTL